MTSKKPLILALVVVNAALLGLLVVLHVDRSAQAQAIPNAVGRFLVVTQNSEDNRSVVWVIDTTTRRMISYQADVQTGKLIQLDRFDLQRTFRYREEGQRPERGVKPPVPPPTP